MIDPIDGHSRNIDESAQMAVVQVRDGAVVRVRAPGGGPVDPLSKVRLLIVRLR